MKDCKLLSLVTKKQKFFRFIWRFNALGITLSIILAIVLSLFALSKIVTYTTRERHVSNILDVTTEQQKDKVFHFGDPIQVEGHDIISIPLYAEQKYDQSYYSQSSTENIVNYVFYDHQSRDTYWLFEHSDFLIVDTHPIPYQDYLDKEQSPVETYIYSVVKEDTNKDGRLTSFDDVSLSISNPNGKNYTELFTKVRRLIGVRQGKKGEIIIVFDDDNGSYIASVSINNFTISHVEAIPELKQENSSQ